MWRGAAWRDMTEPQREMQRERVRRYQRADPARHLANRLRAQAKRRGQVREACKKYHAKNRDTLNAKKRLRRIESYGISEAEFVRLLEAQDGKCAICKELFGPQKPFNGRTPNIDHDHRTEKVRGLLCSNCNHALGNFRDDPDLLSAAIAYLLVGKGL